MAQRDGVAPPPVSRAPGAPRSQDGDAVPTVGRPLGGPARPAPRRKPDTAPQSPDPAAQPPQRVNGRNGAAKNPPAAAPDDRQPGWRPAGFPTEETLESQSRATQELRASIEEVRQLLDVGHPSAPPRRSRRPALLIAALALASVGLLVAAVTLIPWGDLVPERGDPVAGSGVREAPTLAPGAGQGDDPVSGNSTVVAAPAAAPNGSIPANGPGVTAPGSVLLASLAPGGAIDVVEQAVLPAKARTVRLTLPDLTPFSRGTTGMRPAVRELAVSLDGQPLRPEPDMSRARSWIVEADEPVERVLVNYRLTGAVAGSTPSAANRALGLFAPLVGSQLSAQGLPVLVRTESPQVRGLSCPGAAPRSVLCGGQDARGWSALIPPGSPSSALLLQLDLTA